MGLIQSAAQIWRDFVTDGVPSSGRAKPKKADIRAWGGWLEGVITAFTSGAGNFLKTSRAALYADLAHDADTTAWVMGDPTVGFNGIYVKVGASGTGSWTRISDLPFSFIIAADTGAGTPNAIQATSSIPISEAALVWLGVFEPNGPGPTTISFNGEPPLTVKTNGGNDPASGGLVGIALGIKIGSTFRLVSDQASSAILAQAEDILAQTQQVLDTAVATLTAETDEMRDEAQAAATQAQTYALLVGAAVYDFNFDSNPSTPGYDWNNS